MLVKFYDSVTQSGSAFAYEAELDAVPRINDKIELPNGLTGVVTSVSWAIDSNDQYGNSYVSVRLR